MKTLLPPPTLDFIGMRLEDIQSKSVQGVKIKLRVFLKPRHVVGYLQKHQAFSCHRTTECLQSSTEDCRDWGNCTVSPQISVYQTLPT